MSDISNTIMLILFIVMGSYILYLFLRMLFVPDRKPHNRRHGGGGSAPVDSPDYNPTTGEALTPPRVSELLRADGRASNTQRPPWAAPMPKVNLPTQGQYHRREMEWLRLGREMDAPAPAAVPEPERIPAPEWPVRVK